MTETFDQTALSRVAEMMLSTQRPGARDIAIRQLNAQLGPYGDGRAIQHAVDRYFTGHGDQPDTPARR